MPSQCLWKNKKRYSILLIPVLLFISGCGYFTLNHFSSIRKSDNATSDAKTISVIPTTTPNPTYTPNPTLTPFPATTPTQTFYKWSAEEIFNELTNAGVDIELVEKCSNLTYSTSLTLVRDYCEFYVESNGMEFYGLINAYDNPDSLEADKSYSASVFNNKYGDRVPHILIKDNIVVILSSYLPEEQVAFFQELLLSIQKPYYSV